MLLLALAGAGNGVKPRSIGTRTGDRNVRSPL